MGTSGDGTTNTGGERTSRSQQLWPRSLQSLAPVLYPSPAAIGLRRSGMVENGWRPMLRESPDASKDSCFLCSGALRASDAIARFQNLDVHDACYEREIRPEIEPIHGAEEPSNGGPNDRADGDSAGTRW